MPKLIANKTIRKPRTRKSTAKKSAEIVSEKAFVSAPLYNRTGKEIGSLSLPADIFGAPYNPDLISQVYRMQRANRRKHFAHTKDRGEVRGGGKKPWRQKGTGRARHGSRRSPIWKGGGVTFGPRTDRNFSLTVPNAMRIGALFSLLSKKLQDKEIKIIDELAVPSAKTKEMEKILKSMLPESKKYRYQRALVALPSVDVALVRAMRNLPYAKSIPARNLNVYDALQYRFMILPKASVKILQETFLKNVSQ